MEAGTTQAAPTRFEVLVRADLGDGNDPLEATTVLPRVPVKGDVLSVWIQESSREDRTRSHLDREEYLDVTAVALCTWAPESVEVAVSTDGHTDEDLRRIMLALDRCEQP